MKRVLTARFMHETNTFSRVPTDMAMIRQRDYHLENEIPDAFRGTRSAFGATFEAADKFGWTLVHPVSANPNPSGIVTDDAFERITGMILDAVDAKGPIDGALLHLHGAMVSESTRMRRASSWRACASGLAPRCRLSSLSICTPM
jgi:microcystin degradation protein MlrC